MAFDFVKTASARIPIDTHYNGCPSCVSSECIISPMVDCN